MQRRLKTLPAPNLALANWPRSGVRSFIMPDDQFGPVVHRGDAVYFIRTGRVRASGGDYIMASGSPGKACYIIVKIERSTNSTWEAKTFGYVAERFGRHMRTKRRLWRAKWRPVYRCVAYSYTRSDQQEGKAEQPSDNQGGGDAA